MNAKLLNAKPMNEKLNRSKPAVPVTVSNYMRMLAYRAADAIRGTEAARVRGEKMRAAKARKRQERLAAEAAKTS